MKKMSAELARALVAAWQANGICGAVVVPDGEDPGYLPQFVHVRALLAVRNVLASNALWDGMPVRAASLLERFGLSDQRKTKLPSRTYEKKLRARAALNLAAWMQHKEKTGRSGWGVCKGPGKHRSRASRG